MDYTLDYALYGDNGSDAEDPSLGDLASIMQPNRDHSQCGGVLLNNCCGISTPMDSVLCNAAWQSSGLGLCAVANGNQPGHALPDGLSRADDVSSNGLHRSQRFVNQSYFCAVALKRMLYEEPFGNQPCLPTISTHSASYRSPAVDHTCFGGRLDSNILDYQQCENAIIPCEVAAGTSLNGSEPNNAWAGHEIDAIRSTLCSVRFD